MKNMHADFHFFCYFFSYIFMQKPNQKSEHTNNNNYYYYYYYHYRYQPSLYIHRHHHNCFNVTIMLHTIRKPLTFADCCFVFFFFGTCWNVAASKCSCHVY